MEQIETLQNKLILNKQRIDFYKERNEYLQLLKECQKQLEVNSEVLETVVESKKQEIYK